MFTSLFFSEKQLIEREEVHVGQLREKDDHYGTLVGQLKKRIDELEDKLDQVSVEDVLFIKSKLSLETPILTSISRSQSAVPVSSKSNCLSSSNNWPALPHHLSKIPPAYKLPTPLHHYPTKTKKEWTSKLRPYHLKIHSMIT